MKEVLKGNVHAYGDNVDTDVIIPARYLNTSDPLELAKHCMEDIDTEFVKKVKPGDVIVAGRNFGCGSSREHAPIAIRACGVSCVIAESFARIFFRNAINIGLPIVELKDARRRVQTGDAVEIDLKEGKVKNLTSGEDYAVSPHPAFMQEIIESGGLIEMVKKQLESRD
ncbi:MAG TPA: 3-isopropylmalate dehydratase small subunit [Anaerovoracaceae bacterium]|nr:3-isopropylmalate dehydratase small subunit [Anaerovoracaceae bacterium]